MAVPVTGVTVYREHAPVQPANIQPGSVLDPTCAGFVASPCQLTLNANTTVIAYHLNSRQRNL